MKLNETEAKIISKLLNEAANQFSNHGCNDISSDFWEDMNPEDLARMLLEMQKWNGDTESPWPERLESVRDYSLMQFFAEKVERGDQ